MRLLFSFVYLLLFFLFFLCNLIVKKMLSIHQWCHVLDETNKISHSAELQDFQRIDIKYTQHYFYFVACRQKHLSLSFIFGGGANLTVKKML